MRLSERKIVKTISLRKKVAAVAVASLGFGLLSAVAPASADNFAATDRFYCKTAASGTTNATTASTATCTTIADGASQIVIGARAKADVVASGATLFVKTTAGTIAGISADIATNDTGSDTIDTDWGGTADADGFASITITDDADNSETPVNTTAGIETADDVTITINAPAVAATGAIQIYTRGSNGVMTLVESHAISFTTSGSRDLSSVFVSTLPGNDANDCVVANMANADHNSISYDEAADQTNGDADSMDLCVIALDGLGNAVTGATITVILEGPGLIGGGTVASSAADADGILQSNLTGSLQAGVGKFTVTVTKLSVDGKTTITKTGTKSVTWADSKAASVTLTQTVAALDDDHAGQIAVATFSVKDGKSVPIVKADDNGASLVVDSDVASSLVVDVAGETDSSAAVVIETASSVSATGSETQGTISVDCTAGTYEKITIKMHLESNTVASNTITVFCTENIADVTTEKMTLTRVGNKVTATVLAGLALYPTYPVADAAAGTTGVQFVASNGTFSTSTPAIAGGSATVDYYPSGVAAKSTINGTFGDATASLLVENTGTIDGQIAALSARIVALNALIAKIMKRLNIR